MKIDRRRFLITSGASGGLFMSSCKTTSSNLKGDNAELRVRKRWDPEAEDEVKDKFIKAIDWLKANDDKTFEESDPRSYLSYKKIVNAHQKACKHGDWFIFPWHRLFLLYFENACRYALQDETFCVPYWDWTIDRRIPEEFFHNPLLTANRKMKEEDEIPEEFVASKVVEDILASEDFINVHSRPPRPLGIRGGVNIGAFERGPHNGVHNSIGGTMSNPFDSPLDPVFWLHHCNIDRIWATWQNRHPEKILPYKKEEDKTVIIKPTEAPTLDSKAFISRPVITIDPTPWEDRMLELVSEYGPKDSENVVLRSLPESKFNRVVAGKSTIADVLRVSNLGYTYDSIPKPIFQSKLVIRPDRRPRADTQLAGRLTVASDRLVSSISLEGSNALATVKSFLARPDARVSLVADGLIAPEDDLLRSQTILRFFLILGKDAAIKSDFYGKSVIDLYEFAGTHSFFGHPNHGGEKTDTSTSLDLTRTLRKVLAKALPSDIQVLALAMNPAKDYAPVSIFTKEQSLRLALDFSFLDI